MKVVVKFGLGVENIKYTEFLDPVPEPGQVKIKVAFAGVCGTDIKIRHGEYWSNPPVVLGHEFSGIVDEVGQGVTDLKPGDSVTSETAQVICGHCEYCMSGNYLMCSKRLSIGYGTNGAFAEYIVVRREIVHKIPDSIALDEAALCEPAAVAYHSVFDYTSIRPVHTVVIFGPGTIGQLIAQMVQTTGARAILCGTSKDEYRLELAGDYGIETFNSQEADIIDYLNEITCGEGADYAFDCSGAASAVNQALNCLKKKGTLVQVGLFGISPLPIDYAIIPMKELTVSGAFGHINSSWTGVLKLMGQKKVQTKYMITDRFPLEEWEKAFDRAEDLNSLKVLLHP